MKAAAAETFDTTARMLKAVAHPVRIAIIKYLSQEKELAVNDLKDRLHITQSMTSQHLAQLRNAGVLGYSKDANMCRYYISNKNVLKLLDCIDRCNKDTHI